MQNPYVLAAVRKQQRDRALRLPAAQPADHPGAGAPFEFLEGMGAGGPKAGMMRNILCSAAARRMTPEQLMSTRAFLVAGREKTAAKLRELDAPQVIIDNAVRPDYAVKILDRELRKRAVG